MSKRPELEFRVSPSILVVGLPLLACLAAGCDGHDGPSDRLLEEAPAPQSAEEAIGRLTSDERARLEAWQGSLLKGCSVGDVITGEVSEDGEPDPALDLALLEKKLDQKRVLAADDRFALLDPGAPDLFTTRHSEESTLHSITINGRTSRYARALDVSLGEGECVVMVDGFEVARASLRDAIELRAFYDGAREVEQSGAIEVTPMDEVESAYAVVDPAAWLETAQSALADNDDAIPWIAGELGVPGELMQRLVRVMMHGADSHRLLIGPDETAQVSPSMVALPNETGRYPSFLTTQPELFATASAVTIENRYAMWSEAGDLSATLRVNLRRKGELETVSQGYELVVQVSDASVGQVRAAEPDELGRCVAEQLDLAREVYGVPRDMFSVHPNEIFPSCAGYARDPEAGAFANEHSGAALARWFSDVNAASVNTLFRWDGALEHWLLYSLADDATFARLEAAGEGSGVLSRLADAADIMRTELDGLAAADVLRESLPRAVVARLSAALGGGAGAQIDLPRVIGTAEQLHALEPTLVPRYVDGVGAASDEAERAERCVKSLGDEDRTLVAEIKSERAGLADLESWYSGVESPLDLITPWLFGETGCSQEGLVRAKKALSHAADFAKAEAERGLSYSGAGQVADVVALGVAQRWSAKGYEQLVQLATFFRKQSYCDSTAVSEALTCALVDVEDVLPLVDPAFEGRYATLAPELAGYVDKLDGHYVQSSQLLEHFADPLWAACDARDFAQKRSDLGKAVTRIVEAGYSDVSDAVQAFDSALADCL